MTRRIASLLRFAAIYLALSACFALLYLVSSYPELPGSPAEWVAVFVLALPAWLFFEWLGERLWHNPLTRIVDERTAGWRLSLLRIAYGVVLGLAITPLLLGGGFLLKKIFG